MVQVTQHIARLAFRLITVWVIDVASLLITAAIFPGINLQAVGDTPGFIVAVSAALLLGVINLLIRPLILLMALPLGFFAVFGVGFLVNAPVLMITSALLPGFEVIGILNALLGSLILSAVNTVITGLLTIDDDDSFYQGIVERLASRQPFRHTGAQTRGLVMLEIDGLSYWHMQKAIQEGYMPTVARMMREDGYVLSRVDCGLPSQTSACQAGIMFGDNHDIPAFRWLDKEQGKLFVSGKDAPAINARYAKGRGLMRGGSSINNMMDGDAEKSLLTLSNVQTGTPDEKRRRAEDIYLLMLNPYFFTRTIALMAGDILVELWEGWQQRRKDVQPRLDRLHKFYPVLRAATTIFMRDVAAYLAILDILRGSPAIYLTYPGYDEVAHHSGPWTADAFRALRQYDRIIARIRDIIARKAPRSYELILLSDHGQSFGATFRQRYGMELQEFIQKNLPHGTTITQTAGGDDGSISISSISGELDNLQEQGMTGSVGKRVVGQAQKFINQTESRQASAQPAEPAKVTVCGSGNIAQVYFDLHPRKITLGEFDQAYPGLVDALVAHEGVGFVVGYADDGAPIARGKGGRRNLRTGQVDGQDPLAPYGDPALRSEQVRRVAEFPHAGDLIVNSTLYPDGTVAAMEELIGNHGGLGGEQTDAMLLHPADLHLPPINNSADLFAVLNARRDLPAVAARPPEPPPDSEAGSWKAKNLLDGLRQFKVWGPRAIRAFTLDRQAYRAVARDTAMTGPAVLFILLDAIIASLVVQDTLDPIDMLVRFAGSFVGVLLVYLAGRALRSRASYTAVLRAQGFAQTLTLLELLGIIPGLATLAHTVVMIASFIATWLAGVEAHELRGWRTILFPIMPMLVLAVSAAILTALTAGASFTLTSLAQEFGIAP